MEYTSQVCSISVDTRWSAGVPHPIDKARGVGLNRRQDPTVNVLIESKIRLVEGNGE